MSGEEPPSSPAAVTTMTIQQIRSELIELNDSSFVFTRRDELESALSSARRTNSVKGRAGLVTPRAAETPAPAEEEPRPPKAESPSVGTSATAASTADAAATAAGGDRPASRPPAAEAAPFVPPADDLVPSGDASRRLVEYFVMVSSVPVEDRAAQRAAASSRRMKARAPDPSRDKMNSRTKGRFDVRRVHLARTGHGADGADGDGAPQDDAVGNTLLEPRITARYPAADHEDQPLNVRIPQFCHPEGTDLIRPTTAYRMPRVHHFVLTDSMGGKQFGTCLTVYEEFGRGDDGKTTYYAPRVLVLLSTWPYLTAFRTYLTQLYRLATTTDCMTVPIERYVQNICLEVPAPPPGAFEVQLSILSQDIKFWAPPADQPIPYVSLPNNVLFECLDIGNILFAWYTLACERKVLLVSGQLSLLTVCSEILCALLFPMKWSHLYIPVLPRSLSPMLDAPMPYLCGISRDNFPFAVEDISDETVVVDLDRNVITLGPGTPDLPPLPHNRRKKLEAALKANAGDVFWEARNLTKADVLRVRASGDESALGAMLDKAGSVWEERINTRDDAFNLAHAPDSANMEFNEDANAGLDGGELPKQSRWDAVQEAFLRFYVSLLQDYRKFLPAESLQSRSTWRGKEGMSDLRYKKDEFVAAAPSEFQPFLEELAQTQQFDDFVTRRMHNAVDAPDIKFFDQSIDAKSNRSKLKLKKKETTFLHSASARRDLKTVEAVEPSSEGLPPLPGGERAYLYKDWPLNFDESLFCKPRAIPGSISAEFDRRTALRSALRSQYGIVDDARGLGGRNRSPEVTAFMLFFATFTSVIGKELYNVEEKHGNAPVAGVGLGPLDSWSEGVTSGTMNKQSLTNLDDDIAVARTIARAQIDLAFNTLSLMRARRLPPEPAIYKLLIQACGRTRVTHRASQIMEMLARDGLATNSDIYTALIQAFSNDDSQPSSLSPLYQLQMDNMSSLSSSNHGSSAPLDSSGSNRRRSFGANSSDAGSEYSMDRISEQASSTTGGSGSEQGSAGKKKARMKNAKGSLSSALSSRLKGTRSKNKLSQSASSKKLKLKVTAAIAEQNELGEGLLESLYPSLNIDVENICPKCSTVLSEAVLASGWTAGNSNEYETKCSSCSHKFVPNFVVTCKSPTFEGSQGKGTPLYCDLLSPWVLLREIRSVITASGGVDSILDEKFRNGKDIRATLWWNMVVLFKRYKLPFIFLLQGSFQNQLIQPSPNFNDSIFDVSE